MSDGIVIKMKISGQGTVTPPPAPPESSPEPPAEKELTDG